MRLSVALLQNLTGGWIWLFVALLQNLTDGWMRLSVALLQNLIFKDPNGGLGQKNAWFSGQINIGDLHTETARAVDERLFEHVEAGGQSKLFNIILDALEHDDYCQFEVSCVNPFSAKEYVLLVRFSLKIRRSVNRKRWHVCV